MVEAVLDRHATTAPLTPGQTVSLKLRRANVYAG
jgi:hypothetical protein